MPPNTCTHTHNASQCCPKMAEVFVANAEEGERNPEEHSALQRTVPRGDILLKCFVMVASTVSRSTCVYPLKGWGRGGGGGLFALKMVALLFDDTLV